MKKIFVVSMLSILMISGFSTESFAVAAGACVPSGYKDNGECYPCPSNYNNRSIYKNSIEECCIDELTYDANSGMCVSVSAPVSIVDENTTCTVDGIGVDSGTANIEAIWTPNTIHIDWYNQDTKILSNDCTYDGGITLPSNPANRVGYTFGGWRIKANTNNNNNN